MENNSIIILANETATASNSTGLAEVPPPVFWNLSWQAVIVIGVIALVLGTIIVISILKGRNAKKKAASPLVKAILLTLLLVLFLIVTEGMGWYGPDGLPGWIKYGATIAMFFILMMLFKTEESMMNERINKTFPERMKQHVREHFDAELNLGESSGSRAPYCRVLPNTSYGAGDSDVVHYLVMTNANRQVHYVFGLKSGIILDWTEDPGPVLIKEVFRKVPKQVLEERTRSSVQQESQRLEVAHDQQVPA